MKKSFTYIILVLFLSCASKQKTIVPKTTIETTPKLIFLNYSIKKASNGNKSIHFINKIITDGKFKKHSNKYLDEGKLGDLQCYQLDENSNILQSIIIKNPLVKIIEYVDDTKTFHIKKIELDNTSFSLRLKLEPNAKYITISDISDPKKETKPLIKTKL